LFGCGAQTNDAPNSTDAGNPPVIDDQKLRIEEAAVGVLVSGEAGAVTPMASVEVMNLSTRDSASTTAEADGSFEVQIDGGVSDGFRVDVESNGQSTTANVSGGAAEPSVVGKAFLLDSAEGFTPVEGVEVRIDFDATIFGLFAGCNTLGGPYTLCDGKLCIDPHSFGGTLLDCPGEVGAQEDWLSDFFTSTPALTQDGDTLTFEGAEATLVFLDREVADPDRPLTDRVWNIDAYIVGGAAYSLSTATAPTVTFNEDGSFQADTTCNLLSGSFTTSGQTMTLSDVVITHAVCTDTDARAAEARIAEVLDDGTLSYEIDAARLNLMRDDLGLSATTE
jgi:heat shock protein HslJ